MDEGGIFFYGIIERKGNLGLEVRSRAFYAIEYGDLAAVVAVSPVRSYVSVARETLIGYLFTYQSVIEEIMKYHTILPVKFGTFAKDESEVKRVLQTGYTELRDALNRIEGRIEIDLAVIWSDLKEVLREIGESEEIRRIREEVVKRPPEETFKERVRVGRMVKETLDERSESHVAEIMQVLKRCAIDFRAHDILSEGMIMNVAFLVEKAREDEFSLRVEELDDRYRNRVNFRCVGPLPPYSFSTIEIEFPDFQRIEDARKILCLGEEASEFEIKRAHRRLVHQFHPDKNLDIRVADKFFELTEAYRALIDYLQGDDRCSFRETDLKDTVRVRISGSELR